MKKIVNEFTNIEGCLNKTFKDCKIFEKTSERIPEIFKYSKRIFKLFKANQKFLKVNYVISEYNSYLSTKKLKDNCSLKFCDSVMFNEDKVGGKF